MSITRVPLAPQPSEIQERLHKLAANAQKLNDLSDSLTKQLTQIESAINKLNIGVAAEVNSETYSSEDGLEYDIWRLAYQKYDKKWGFVVEHLSGHEAYPDGEFESWPFKDAPREHRIAAVLKVPELLDALLEKSERFASEISGSVSYAQSIASSLAAPSRDGSKR